MIAMLMAISLIGSVILIGVCTPLAPAEAHIPPAPYSFEQAIEPNIRGNWHFDFPVSQGDFDINIEGGYEMQADVIKDQMRQGIVEKSIQILRRHGKSDEEIRSMILKDFHIGEEALDKILNSETK